jgi:P-type E1-E2 ATPase
VTTVALDKTGTLTLGRPEVCGVIPADGSDAATVLTVAAQAELGSEHPLAAAIVTAAGPVLVRAGDLQAVPGSGVVFRPEGGGIVLVGSTALLQSHGVQPGSLPPTSATVAHVARDGRWLGAILLGDRPRPEAAAVMTALGDLGLTCVMLTGDRAEAAAGMAGATGIPLDRVHAGLSPLAKGEWIQAAEAAGQLVAFAGDGLNDGPALAGASVGISLAGATDVALSAAHVVLTAAGLQRLPETVALARWTRGVMRQNLVWAIGYNLVAVPLAVSGLATPLVAAAAMVLSSLSVVANSLRLSVWRPRDGGAIPMTETGWSQTPNGQAPQTCP